MGSQFRMRPPSAAPVAAAPGSPSVFDTILDEQRKALWDRFLAIWWEDCVWNIGPPFGTFHGHAGITTAVKDVLWPVWRESHHLTSNLRVQFSDADNAHGVCDVDCMGATRDDVVQMISATYKDHFQRRNGVWRILQRDVTIHYFNPIPGAQMTPPASN
jgi:hypothetical protein